MPKLSRADKAAKVSANEARRRKELALAELREMERDQRAGKLIPADQVSEAWLKVLVAVKDGVLRMPEKTAPQVAATGDVREARGILLTECESILRTIHDELLRLTPDGTSNGRGDDATARANPAV